MLRNVAKYHRERNNRLIYHYLEAFAALVCANDGFKSNKMPNEAIRDYMKSFYAAYPDRQFSHLTLQSYGSDENCESRLIRFIEEEENGKSPSKRAKIEETVFDELLRKKREVVDELAEESEPTEVESEQLVEGELFIKYRYSFIICIFFKYTDVNKNLLILNHLL